MFSTFLLATAKKARVLCLAARTFAKEAVPSLCTKRVLNGSEATELLAAEKSRDFFLSPGFNVRNDETQKNVHWNLHAT